MNIILDTIKCFIHTNKINYSVILKLLEHPFLDIYMQT